MEPKNYRPRPIIKLNALEHIHHNTASLGGGLKSISQIGSSPQEGVKI